MPTGGCQTTRPLTVGKFDEQHRGTRDERRQRVQTVEVRIALFISEDWYARSHRLALIKGAVARGHEVLLLTHVDKYRLDLEEAGATVVSVPLDRSASSPTGEARAIIAVTLALRDFRPDVLHNVALKPILYGTAAAVATRVPAIVNAMAGLGALFIDDSNRSREALLVGLARVLRSRRSWVVVQNPDDRQVVERLGVSPGRITLIRGSGVETASFHPVPEPAGPEVVARFFGRLLWDKGVGELHQAAVDLRARSASIRVELVGSRDAHNPACIDEATLEAWRAEGAVTLHGQVDDVRSLINGSNIVLLPSYREGLPKALLEGAAAGRALIATDVPGCREVVIHENNGLLVPARNARALADALARLAMQPERRKEMGTRSRQRARSEFDVSIVVGKTLELYERAVQG